MLEIILELCEVASVAVSGFLVKKYVLLGASLPPERQRLFCLFSAAVLALVYLLLGKDAAEIAVFVLIVVNIALARRGQPFRVSTVMIFFAGPGIINGLFVPLMRLPPYLLSLSERGAALWQLGAFGAVFALLAVFYFKGKNWRRWFEDNARERELRLSEQVLLSVMGVLMLAFSSEAAARIEADADHTAGISYFMAISGVVAFVMTVTMIVLIMQGNKRAYYHKQVTKMQFNIITMMADIVENRDGNTGGHIKRTAKYVELIAKELRRRGAFPEILTEKYAEDMIVAAPLHDIGKIHISDLILNKPGKLTDEEFEIMKTHAAAGSELLEHAKEELGESGYLNIAQEMALYHHERWDGRGYPCKIGGEEIPLCARIMAVADVFDALTAKRCYKSAMPLEKAIGIIREETGTHFDPTVAGAFLELAGRGEICSD